MSNFFVFIRAYPCHPWFCFHPRLCFMTGFLNNHGFHGWHGFPFPLSTPSVSSVVLFCLSPYDSFPLQLGFLEVEQQRHFKTRDIQVTEHLREMGLVERGNDLGVHDHQAFYNQVGNKLADQMASVVNRTLPLLLGPTPA